MQAYFHERENSHSGRLVVRLIFRSSPFSRSNTPAIKFVMIFTKKNDISFKEAQTYYSNFVDYPLDGAALLASCGSRWKCRKNKWYKNVAKKISTNKLGLSWAKLKSSW